MRLTALARNLPAYVDSIDWSAMPDADGRRLRELGLCEGASIELLHRGGLLAWLLGRFGMQNRGTHACRVGRMTVAMRASHAAAIAVRTGPAPTNGADAEA
ncbi:MAG: ferrous iron transport protein A [Sphingobium sp.]|nr:ferrous iron transport protein A [Sphingobium sp.]